MLYCILKELFKSYKIGVKIEILTDLKLLNFRSKQALHKKSPLGFTKKINTIFRKRLVTESKYWKIPKSLVHNFNETSTYYNCR
jgi:hypothetical protein